MEFKYIVMRVDNDGMIQEIPIVFPKQIGHKSMAQALSLECRGLIGSKAVRAGFVDLDTRRTYGDSSSLRLNSADSDKDLISMFNCTLGLVNE